VAVGGFDAMLLSTAALFAVHVLMGSMMVIRTLFAILRPLLK